MDLSKIQIIFQEPTKIGKIISDINLENVPNSINDKIKAYLNIKAIQNPAKKDNVHAAKLFYAVYDKENVTVPLYKWEIRWKGDIFVSPQILTFKWNPDKDHLKIIKAKE
jgi:hypothetical protein